MRFDLIVLLIFLLCIAISDYKRAVIPDAYILAGITFRRNYFQDPVFNLFEKLYKYLEKSGFCPADLCAVIADDGGI